MGFKMELADYKRSIIEKVQVDVESAVHGSDPAREFAKIVVESMREVNCFDNDYVAAPMDMSPPGKARMKLSGYIYEPIDSSLHIFYVVWSDDDIDDNLTKEEAETAFKRMRAAIVAMLESKLNLDIGTAVYGLYNMIQHNKKNHKKDIERFKFYILTNKKKSVTNKEPFNVDIAGYKTNCEIWDLERLYENYKHEEKVTVNFKKYGKNKQGIPCIALNAGSCLKYKSYICVIPGKILADIYGEYGARLMENNVRSYLTKTKINSDIAKTISECPSKFFAFNNGIAAIASSVKINADNSRLISAEDFQIVNGGQTTATLYFASKDLKGDKKISYEKNIEDIYVQMKLTEMSAMEEEEQKN